MTIWDAFVAASSFRGFLTAMFYGVFKLTAKEGNTQIQASCPFHMKSDRTACKQSMTFPDDVRECQVALAQLFTWCLRARNHSRQRLHMPDWPEPAEAHNADLLGRMMIRSMPAGFARKTDTVLDAEARDLGFPIQPFPPRGGGRKGAEWEPAMAAGAAQAQERWPWPRRRRAVRRAAVAAAAAAAAAISASTMIVLRTVLHERLQMYSKSCSSASVRSKEVQQ